MNPSQHPNFSLFCIVDPYIHDGSRLVNFPKGHEKSPGTSTLRWDTRDVSIGRARCVRDARFGANEEREGVVGDDVIRSARQTRDEAR